MQGKLGTFCQVVIAIAATWCRSWRSWRSWRRKYGGVVEGGSDQIAMFRRCLLFARDTIRFRKPMNPDVHWSPMSGHVATLMAGGGRYDHIFFTEHFDDGMNVVLDAVETPHAVDLARVPRFNETSGQGPDCADPVADFFDDPALQLTYEIYKRHFGGFRYDPWGSAEQDAHGRDRP